MSLDPTLPIKLDSTSNGEYAPWPVGRTVNHAKQLAAERIATHAGRTGQSRRVFLTGLCGAATTLLAFNDAFAWRGHRGGSFELPREAAFEPAAALAAVGGREFIFDIQTHMVEADGAWRRERPTGWTRPRHAVAPQVIRSTICGHPTVRTRTPASGRTVPATLASGAASAPCMAWDRRDRGGQCRCPGGCAADAGLHRAVTVRRLGYIATQSR